MADNLNLDNITLIPLMDTLKLTKITDQVYFSNEYKDYISNSRLGLINPDQDGSPEKYFGGFPKTCSDAFVFGSAVHGALLQPEYFKLIETVDRPTAKAGYIADSLFNTSGSNPTDDDIIKACIDFDYYHGDLNPTQMQQLKDKILPYLEARYQVELDKPEGIEYLYLDPRGRERFHGCMNNLNSNQNIQKLLHPMGLIEPIVSENEWTILLDMEIHIGNHDPFVVKLKSKLDNFTIDKENNKITVNDLKTHGRMLNLFEENIQRYHYYRELAMYSTLLNLVAKKFYGLDNPTVEGNFLVVSTIPQYYTKVSRMDKTLYTQGIAEFHKLLKMVCHYTYYGV